MLVKVVTITLVVCTIAGSRADVSNDKVVDAILNYFTPLSSGTKDDLLKVQLSDSKRLTSALIEESLKSLNVEDLESKITVFAKLINAQMTLDYGKLLVQKELEELRIKLSPYSGVVYNHLSKTTEELKGTLTLFDEELQASLGKNTLAVSEKLKNIVLDLSSKIRENADHMPLSLAPYSLTLQVTFTESLVELSKNLLANTVKMSEKIDQQVLDLYQSLSPFAEDMQDSLRKQIENMSFQMKKSISLMASKILESTAQLKKEMSFFTALLKEENNLELRTAQKTLDLYMIKVNQKVAAFKDTVTLCGDILNQALLKTFDYLKQMLVKDSVTEQDQIKYLEKSFLDKISKFINSTLLKTMTSSNIY